MCQRGTTKDQSCRTLGPASSLAPLVTQCNRGAPSCLLRSKAALQSAVCILFSTVAEENTESYPHHQPPTAPPTSFLLLPSTLTAFTAIPLLSLSLFPSFDLAFFFLSNVALLLRRLCTRGSYVLNWIIRRFFFLFRWCLHTSVPTEVALGAKRQSRGGSAEVFLGRRVRCTEPELLPVFMKWLFHGRPVPWENLSVSVHARIVFSR